MSNTLGVDQFRLEQALSRLQLMYAKPAHPYYISAPDYRETSSGVCVLHYLCHVLNQNGQDAYIVGGKVVNPDLKTPLLDQATAEGHIASGKVPIIVYPEVTSGNPLNGKVVARYVLNVEGFLTGRMMDEEPGDLLFFYDARIAAEKSAGVTDLLCFPIIDISLFSAPDETVQRKGHYLYQNRHPLDQVDYSSLPEGIRLLSVANPLSLRELAEVLRSAEVLYSYEWSMTCSIAVLCGCPVIFMAGYGIDQTFLDGIFFGKEGCAVSDQVDALAVARAGVKGALQRYAAVTAQFWQQLDVFIEKTQAAAVRQALADRQGMQVWLEQRCPDEQQRAALMTRLANGHSPRLGVLVLDNGDAEQALTRTLESLAPARCLYPNLQVVTLGDAASVAGVPGLSVRHLPCQAEQRSAVINQVVADSAFDWFMVVEAGVEFTPGGFLLVAQALANATDDRLAFYADEAMRMGNGTLGISLRPDLNLDLLLSLPASVSSHWLFQRNGFLAQGGFDTGCGEAFELEYQLRLIEQRGLSGIEHISEPLLVCEALCFADSVSEREVINRHLQARGYGQAQVNTYLPGHYQLDYGHAGQPMVSIVILLDGVMEQFQRSIEALLQYTDYPAYEVLLLNAGSDDPQLRQWLQGIEQIGGDQLRVLPFAPGQSAALLRNEAGRLARGEYLLWLDAAAAPIAQGWLQQLLNHAQRPEVAAVGGKLLTMNGKIHHAGLVLGLRGPVGRAFTGYSHSDTGYMQRLMVDQDYSALSGECLMLRRDLFVEVGGFDEAPELARWMDVDLCLRLRQAGFLNVWTPHAQLLIDRPALAAASVEEEDALYARWLPVLGHDPAYNPHLSLTHAGGFKVASLQSTWHSPQGQREVPVLSLHPLDQGDLGYSRVVCPFNALKAAGCIDGQVSPGVAQLVELERLAADVVVFQGGLDEPRLEAMRRIQAFSRAFTVLDLSDYLPDLPLGSARRKGIGEDIFHNLQRALGYVDRLVVPTTALAKAFAGLHADIRVVETRLPIEAWRDVQGRRRTGARPRLGWVGNSEQATDLNVIAPVIKALAADVEWVFFGYCPSSLQPYVHEYHDGVDVQQYPQTLAGLNLDLALVPLEQSLFNVCKGNQRQLEFGACAVPVICSDIGQGQDNLPVARVSNSYEHWIEAIGLHLANIEATQRRGDELKDAVHRYWMFDEEHQQRWCSAWLPG
ncbi:glycosyltransferase family 2 protein [Pseudomonas wadenswilerensis]|uniref:Glycosyltransferase 2-like domain-containing protein n=1 Tax=Pseudomonas wadenswilerensis TaxID=1785161 RepID=A0A380T2R3_9PSED|nr:glycosyltransferase [Pseudomonas wadenswilerensis]SUQ64539.1 hypothetical protein CCOS864_04000 [Pseudomonas wadenswilerensis]